MKKLIASTCALVLVAFCGVQTARAETCNGATANLITNCGFETGDFTGWSGTATTDVFSGVGSNDPVNGSLPYEGNYMALLGTLDGTSTLSQSFATTAGQTYTIEFALADDYPGTATYPNSFAALWDSTTMISGTAPAGFPFTLFSFTETATGSSTTLSFTTENDAAFWDLDSISVVGPAVTTPTPEPSSLLLLGTGLMGVAGTLRRRFRL